VRITPALVLCLSVAVLVVVLTGCAVAEWLRSIRR
jgi:hypothetical protein